MQVASSGPNSATSKLLPQGSGGTFLGRPSALLGDSTAKPATPVVGVPVPVNQGQYSTALQNPVGILERERVAVPPKQTSPAMPLPAAVLQKKSESLLKEYLSVADLNEVLLCVEELKSPDFHPQLVQLAVSMGLQSQDRDRELIRKLLEFLCSKKVLSERDVRTGIMMVADLLEDLALDIPMAPKHIGDLVGKASLAGVAELGLLVDIIQNRRPNAEKVSI